MDEMESMMKIMGFRHLRLKMEHKKEHFIFFR